MDDLSRLTMRELLTLARERLGSSAAGLKTRDELVAALRAARSEPEPGQAAAGTSPEKPPPGAVAPAAQPVVVRDFFRRRT